MSSSQKRILIINSCFDTGGIETALVNMANELCESYSIDLLVYKNRGPMRNRLNPKVNVLEPSAALKAMGMSPKEVFKTKNFFMICFKCLCAAWTRVFDNRFPVLIASFLQPKLKGYDLAIAYRGETRKKSLLSGYIRILDRCVESKKKVAWIHYDAEQYKDIYAHNEKYYRKVDKIICVSKSVAEKFKKANPSVADKTDYCCNFINFKELFENSQKEQQVKYEKDKFVCFSACRLSEEKGILRAISALSPTLKEHKDIMWYIAGDGPERAKIEAAVKSEGLEKRIVLLGNQTNPYPYMKNADIYLSVSFHEAAPVVYTEAKALGVPVFSTEITSSYEMLNDQTEDFICENSEEGIRNAFKDLAENREKVKNAKKNRAEFCKSNDESVLKIKSLLK